jgi:site-specific recombinase XerD
LKTNQFPPLLHAFFHDWLVQQRNVSHHTVLSYRDSWRLFLRFVAAHKKKSVARLGMDDLTAAEVLGFLKDIEQIRKSSIGTRNCRLSALHSFYRFVADREPLAAAQCAAVLRIPTKQAPVVEVRDLDEDEISAILAQPNRLKLEGQRVTSYWRSYITLVHVSKRRWISLSRPFAWNRPFRFACSVKVEKSESALFGPRLLNC